ncbi:hypothetical protein EJB05_16862 [Eragrostis curvula]|uniref:Tunicamycin induced 1 n=1 Tax=Eragrostis curvula TaxID=38414 RepID=A0A5J9VJ01_9POAL|nr:hypothetical protein EJB05_16862 [Eragrostis curvula]
MAAAGARWRLLLALPLALFLAAGSVEAAAAKPPVPKAISDLRDAIVKGLGFQAEGLKVSGFDVRDALVGQAVAYEFDIEVGRKVLPVRLLEDVSRWDFVDLPIFRSQADADDTALAEIRRRGRGGVVEPTLPPFQLAGPMELWIQDADDVRLALPHDVDAGTLKKVVLSDGAVVTVKGAKAVSLRLPLELPLPLNRTTYKGRLSSLLSIAQALRGAARSNQKPLLSLRIEGPTSLSSTPSMSPNDKLKLKRLAPGQVELSSRAAIPSVTEDEDEPHNTGLWPLLSLNGSDASLQGFEELLASVLGKKAGEKGTFKLLKARASAQTYVKMAFAVEKRLADGDVDWSKFPEWKTKPNKLRAHYEVLARVEGGQAIPERIAQVQPFQADEATSPSVLTGNVTMSKQEIVHPPPVYFTL